MSYINLNLDTVKEAVAAPKGEYELQITAAQATESGQNS